MEEKAGESLSLEPWTQEAEKLGVGDGQEAEKLGVGDGREAEKLGVGDGREAESQPKMHAGHSRSL